MKRLDPLALPLTGTKLIEASAGTGKTYTITTLFLRLLLERQISVDKILVVTFTNAAAAELRQRIRRRLRETLLALGQAAPPAEVLVLLGGTDPSHARLRLIEAMHGLDEASIFTIHGFCQRALHDLAFEGALPFDLELMADDRPLLMEVIQDFWAREVTDLSLALVTHLRERGVGPGSLEKLARWALGSPELEVRPAAPDAPGDGRVELERYLRTRAVARDAWQAHRAQIVAALQAAPLKRTEYAPGTLAKVIDALDDCLRRTRPSLAGWSGPCEKLGATRLSAGTKKGHRPPEHPLFHTIDELCRHRAQAADAMDRWLLGFRHRFIEFVRREMRERKLSRRLQSFDDLLQALGAALAGSGGPALAKELGRRYPAALIDEFQDTDPIQYDIFRRIYRDRGTLLLIGDPKQAIYAFRGADIFAYLRAAADAAEQRFTLGTNYRSDPALISAVNTVFSAAERPFRLDGIHYPPVEPRPGAVDCLSDRDGPASGVDILFVPRDDKPGKREINKRWAETELPRLIAADISRRLDRASGERIDQDPVEPRHIAVLTRTNRQALRIQRELRALSIPSVLHGDASVFDSGEASELWLVLRALAEPSSSSAVTAALLTSLFGLNANQIHTLRGSDASWEHQLEAFRRWHAIWETRGFLQCFRALLGDEAVATRMLSLVDGERRFTNFTHLAELLHAAACQEHLGVAGLLKWYDAVRFDEEARLGMAPDDAQIRLETDAAAVQLTTMHRSKGLEYPVVYCPFLWDGVRQESAPLRFHDPDSGRLVLHLSPDETDKELAQEEARAEHLRLCYVALTRAKHRSIVVWGAFKGHATSPLAHLLHGGAPSEGRAPAQRLAAGDDQRMLSDLQRLGERSGGTLRCRILDDDAAAVAYTGDGSSTVLTDARRFERVLLRALHSSSFSALISGRTAVAPRDEGRDEDPAGLIEVPEAPRQDAVRLVDFPRGPGPGTALHGIFECLDFTAADEGTLAALVDDTLCRHGLDAERFGSDVALAIQDVLATPVPAGDAGAFKLSEIPKRRRWNELEFVLPVADPGGDRRARRAGAPPPVGLGLTPDRLADVFADVQPSYAPRVRALGFAELSGFLRGFIDLVVEHAGRIFVIDYKSNYLGAAARDYAPERLGSVMAHHHYYLQYYLYSLAVHRLLALRLPDYDYDRHFGGVAYLFVRGMSPTHPLGTGVHFDRPERAALDRLARALAPNPAAA